MNSNIVEIPAGINGQNFRWSIHTPTWRKRGSSSAIPSLASLDITTDSRKVDAMNQASFSFENSNNSSKFVETKHISLENSQINATDNIGIPNQGNMNSDGSTTINRSCGELLDHFLMQGDILAKVQLSNNQIHQIVSPISGTLHKMLVEDGNDVSNKTIIAHIAPCTHPFIFNTMCTLCTAVVSASSIGRDTVIIEDSKPKKLSLVLDLDQTLIHAYRCECIRKSGNNPNYSELLGTELERIGLDEGFGVVREYLIKLRPYAKEFLANTSEFCQLSIYTAGTRDYADAVVRIIDPEHKYFHGRIISRNDMFGDTSQTMIVEQLMEQITVTKKDLNNLNLHDSKLAIVLDDRTDAWKASQYNHIFSVKPYVCHSFYKHRCDGPPIPSPSFAITLSGDNPGERLEGPEAAEYDDQLLRCYDVLQHIHRELFNENSSFHSQESRCSSDSRWKPSVADLMTSMKRSVLQGCVVVFSELFSPSIHPCDTELGVIAVELGARVDTKVTEFTTHLISSNPNTKKAQECISRKNIWILHPHWLYYCRWALARVMEKTFTLIELNGEDHPKPVLLHERDPGVNADETSSKSVACSSSLTSNVEDNIADSNGNTRLVAADAAHVGSSAGSTCSNNHCNDVSTQDKIDENNKRDIETRVHKRSVSELSDELESAANKRVRATIIDNSDLIAEEDDENDYIIDVNRINNDIEEDEDNNSNYLDDENVEYVDDDDDSVPGNFDEYCRHKYGEVVEDENVVNDENYEVVQSRPGYENDGNNTESDSDSDSLDESFFY